MSNGNPLEQLRRRMQSHATPTAFAALAEEYRRAGRFADAITVCRDGLERYPAYASARVTLGRALLDSGDVPAAVAELELAVAQSPDNLAAARALQAAHDALGEEVVPSPAVVSPIGELRLRAAADEETDSIPSEVIARALSGGPDTPQEFGLDPDWSIPATPPADIDYTANAGSWLVDRPSETAVEPTLDMQGDAPAASEVDATTRPDHAESPTMLFVPPHLQGDEPAGIWTAPDIEASHDVPVVGAGARVVSWALDPPDAPELVSSPGPTVAESAAATAWDAPTMDAPLTDVAEASLDSANEAPAPVLAEGEPAATTVTSDQDDAASGPGAEDAVAEGSPFWTGLFAAESEPVTSEPFAGWASDAPQMAAAAPWAGEQEPELIDTWAVPDGPSATWALGDLTEAAGADATPFQRALDAPDAMPVPFASIPAPDAVVEPVASAAGVAWAGSVRSALGEVFALAGHGESLEPPTHGSLAVRTAMAEAAVEAAIEDAALREDVNAPVLASLEQMLTAVRARRAQLAGAPPS